MQVSEEFDGNAFLMGGLKTPSLSFDGQFPISYEGVVIEGPKAVQQRNYDTDELEFWEDGKPKMQAVIKLQTDQNNGEPDDIGERSLWLRGEAQKAVALAVRQSGAKGIQVGGHLWIEYYDEKANPAKPGQKKKYPTKLYRARYTPPLSDGNQAIMNAPDPTPAYSAGKSSTIADVRQVAAQNSAMLQAMRQRNHQGAAQDGAPPF